MTETEALETGEAAVVTTNQVHREEATTVAVEEPAIVKVGEVVDAEDTEEAVEKVVVVMDVAAAVVVAEEVTRTMTEPPLRQLRLPLTLQGRANGEISNPTPSTWMIPAVY